MAFLEMTRMTLKWALSSPVTCHYPFEPRVPLADSRGRLVFTKETCVYCSVCAKRCPTGALTVARTQKRWGIDRLLCITCGNCVEVCPRKSLALETAHDVPVVTKDRENW
jgi:ech hydrogenase subunit F